MNSEIESKGARLIFIGNGSPHFIKAFKEEFGIKSPVYTDPTLKVYKAAAMKRGAFTFMNPKVIANTARMIAHGHRQIGVQGDRLQQGGVVVVRPGGKVAYAYSSKVFGDFPPNDDILNSL